MPPAPPPATVPDSSAPTPTADADADADAAAHFARGNHQAEQGDMAGAIASYEQALQCQPGLANAWNNRGNALKASAQLHAAVASYDQAIAIDPGHADAWSNRGAALHQLRELAAALASLDTAIQRNPEHADAWCNRGITLLEMRQPAAAIASYDSAIRLNPQCAQAYWNKSLALLLCADFANGWPLYEWRRVTMQTSAQTRQHPQPLWLGDTPLAGKSILLHAEQGLGDALQMCRYAAPVAALGARVVMEVPAPLHNILQGLPGVHDWVSPQTPRPHYDYHCPFLSLPLALNTTLANIPGQQPYLRSSASARARWHALWAAQTGPSTRPRVGLVWRGSAQHANDAQRSMALQTLLAWLPPGLDYVSLQPDLQGDEAPALQAAGVRDVSRNLHDFSDTAALCDLLDVVVSVDTSVAHLAAALGRPTWILLPWVPDWRWLLDRSDSPWYPTARLYRQTAAGDWDSALQPMAAALRALPQVSVSKR